MPPTESHREVTRFSWRERTVHWLAALSFLYAALTGLSLWSHHLFWLGTLFGGGVWVRIGHPYGGLLLSLALGILFATWGRQMRLDGDDRAWLREVKRYAKNDEAGLPEPGRFNAGQKLLFWGQSGAAVLLLASGVALWFPSSVPRALVMAATLVHPIAAVVAIGGILLHIYMGTAAVPGSFRAMARGVVSRRWAAHHHPKWLREIEKG